MLTPKIRLLSEADDRADRRVTRLLHDAKLPKDKTLATLDLNRYAAPLRGQIRELLRGEFLTGATNVCLIGRPGTGKSHVMAALARALLEAGHPVLFVPVVQLVERLLDAKKNLRLARELKRLDNFDCIALDDIGYVQRKIYLTPANFQILSITKCVAATPISAPISHCVKYFWSQRSALVTSAAAADLTELNEVTIGSVIRRYSIKLQK